MKRLLLGLVLLGSPVLAEEPDGGAASRRPVRTLREVKLLYFWASWCASCRAFETSDVLGQLKSRLPGLVVEKVDVDAKPDQVEHYGVTHTPTLVLVDAAGFPLGKPELKLADPEGTLARLEKLVRKMAQVP
jgi:thiol-disulfide isomerase/thioredoxin